MFKDKLIELKLKLTEEEPDGYEAFKKVVYDIFTDDEVIISQTRDYYIISFEGKDISLYYDIFNKTFELN